MERLKVFDENYTYLRDEHRDRVHRDGLWHETFHCWLVDDQFLYIQKRSDMKRDFPGQFDITAAGHILSTESVADGIREVEEELGIVVDLTKLHSKGVVQNSIKLPNFIDREFSNVFLYDSAFVASEFSLQHEEVESVHVVERKALIDLFVNEVMTVKCVNIFDGAQSEIGLMDFVPHERKYFEQVAQIFKG
ncbi:NUDIX domain-containing protein [Sporosarcina sp. ANT_H38]|uniref:NUDIX hydrolase n=1 Tax=Sporosarcina sp. ANT_H38 TaxID=2597358 RepID=UPI0011F2AE06|nr:NUDIX domain-containing protein [Sporosarcina sp. ANT_H38]KAA0940469.1 NUDIX domain-containing protein [Sporosarcina sp. ANT_H38]